MPGRSRIDPGSNPSRPRNPSSPRRWGRHPGAFLTAHVDSCINCDLRPPRWSRPPGNLIGYHSRRPEVRTNTPSRPLRAQGRWTRACSSRTWRASTGSCTESADSVCVARPVLGDAVANDPASCATLVNTRSATGSMTKIVIPADFGQHRSTSSHIRSNSPQIQSKPVRVWSQAALCCPISAKPAKVQGCTSLCHAGEAKRQHRRDGAICNTSGANRSARLGRP